MERLHGVRFPWAAHQRLHVVQAIVLTLATAWLGLKLFRRIKPTIDPAPYLAAALLAPIGGVVICISLGWPELAALAAIPVLAFLLSRHTGSLARKLALGLVGLVPFLLLLSLDDYRAAVELGGFPLPAPVLFLSLFVVTFPFVLFLAHVASFQNCLHSPVWWRLSGPRVGAGLVVSWLGLAIAGVVLPAYNAAHRPIVQVRQRVDLVEGRARLTLHSAERITGVRLGGVGGRLIVAPGGTETIDLPFPADRLAFEAALQPAPGGGPGEVLCATQLKAPRPADRTSYLFTSRSGFRIPGHDDTLRHHYTFTEVSQRLDPQRIFRLVLPPGGDLELALRADFDTDLLGVEPQGSTPVFAHQGTITDFRSLAPRAAR